MISLLPLIISIIFIPILNFSWIAFMTHIVHGDARHNREQRLKKRRQTMARLDVYDNA